MSNSADNIFMQDSARHPMARGDDRRFVGIDLGTTYSAIAWLDPHGTPVTLTNTEDETTTPSVVLFEPTGEVVVGREAKRAALIVPDLVADHVKREMGQPQYHKKINEKAFSPSAISALVLKKLRQDAERRIGKIAGAVITVPAYFDEKRRRATAAAGEIAGLNVIDILNEPTAAAMAYAFRDFVKAGGEATDPTAMHFTDHTAVVYDLGGGTFDVTVLQISGDDLTVLATDGDGQLGGRDFDERIIQWACQQFHQRFGGDPHDDPHSLQGLVIAAEEAKKDLSRLPKTRLLIMHAGRSLRLELTREEFEQMTADLLDRTRQCLTRVMIDAGVTWPNVQEILAVGGSSRMPMVLDLLRNVTGKEPNCSLPPAEAVAHGAAIHAAIRACQLWAGKQKAPTRVHTPSTKIQYHHTADEAEDADGAIAELDDAAREKLLDAVLSGEVIDLQIEEDPSRQFDQSVGNTLKRVRKTDVNAHTLGVVVTRASAGRGRSVLIPRNTPLPATSTKVYGTLKPNQPEVVIRILEGEDDDVERCSALGVCRITGLPPHLPQGSPVRVTFMLDSSGRLHVEAVEMTSGRSVQTDIQCDAGITQERIERAREAIEKMPVV